MRVKGKRKEAAERLSELTGEKAIYTRLPRCAYEVGSFTIEKDGTLLARECADLSFLRTLSDEGFLEGFEERVFETPKAYETPEIPKTNEAPETLEVPETIQPEKYHDAFISLPMAGHTVRSLRNLIHMIYVRGKLLSKATGGEFFCTEELAGSLNGCEDIEEIITVSQKGLTGLKFTEDWIAFTGFPSTQDAKVQHVFKQLSERMNEKAKYSKHVILRRIDETNERYIFRSWLMAIGMKGPEFKTARKMLLSPLSGHSAFRDEAMKIRWKEKQAARRTHNPPY